VKAPWFKLWAADTLREMRWLTPEQRGYLFALVCEAWLSEPKGHIPINRDMIWKLAGADSKEKFEAASGPVLEMFEQVGECYCYRKLVEQDKEIKQVSQSRSDAGKNGAKSRWQGDGKQITSAIPDGGNQITSVIGINAKNIASVIPNDDKRIADLDVRSRRDETEEMREESAREEKDLAPGGASTSWPFLSESDDEEEDIPDGSD
jgi:uncharacterized protein YdaU (DUF1376 family)